MSKIARILLRAARTIEEPAQRDVQRQYYLCIGSCRINVTDEKNTMRHTFGVLAAIYHFRSTNFEILRFVDQFYIQAVRAVSSQRFSRERQAWKTYNVQRELRIPDNILFCEWKNTCAFCSCAIFLNGKKLFFFFAYLFCGENVSEWHGRRLVNFKDAFSLIL